MTPGFRSPKRFKLFWYLVAFSLLPACSSSLPAAGGPTTPPPATSNNDGAAHPVAGLDDLELPLISRYYRIIEHDKEDGKEQFIGVSEFRYMPRQSSFSGFENWDMLATPWPWGVPAGNAWLHFSLNRDANVTLVINKWSEAASWLDDWSAGTSSAYNEKGEQVEYKTYSKRFSQGEHILPHLPDTKYTLLLAEADGTPSAEPALPDGISDRPQANETCPAWLANSWTSKGPDGRIYKTWHPQIDPVYWCYYRHEHGSDPSLVKYSPTLDYIAYHNNQQNEQHEGFKGFAFIEDGVGWYINVHATTGMIGRACVRFHTVVFHAADMATGKTLLELGYKGDYGAVVDNQNEDILLQPQLDNCPDQNAIYAETSTHRKALRVFQGSADPGNYERWNGGTNRYLGMDFPDWSAGMTVDIRNPVTGCNSQGCSAASYTDTNGEQRSLRFQDLSFSYNSLLDKSDGSAGDGIFYTDAYGVVQDDDSKNTVRQFIAPEFTAHLDGEYISQDAWRGLYVKGKHMLGLELEDALGNMN